MTTKQAGLAKVLTGHELRRLAGPEVFKRGVEYAHGCVLALAGFDGGITAKVARVDAYRVRIWPRGRTLGYSCTCPASGGRTPCKHVVAAGLAWLDRAGGNGPRDRGYSPPVATSDIRAYLDGLAKSELVEIMMARAGEDPVWQSRLVAGMGISRKGTPGPAALPAAFDLALASGDASGRYDSSDHLECLEALVVALESMRSNLQGSKLAVMARHAAVAMKRAFDESDVLYEPVTELVQRLRKLCRRSGPS